jgi:RNA polymerase sigma factor (sigma-70 family)
MSLTDMTPLADRHGTVTAILIAIRSGDRHAQSSMWRICHPQLRQVARQMLRPKTRAVADEDDVLVEVMCSVLQRLELGRYPEVQNRQDLFRLLHAVTVRRAINLNRHAAREKRGSTRRALNQDQLLSNVQDPRAQFLGRQEELAHLLSLLPEDLMRTVALMRLDGYCVTEIATMTNMSLPTIERRLRSIREIWSARLEPGAQD